LFPSASDAPLGPFQTEGSKSTKERLRELSGAEEGANVEESSLDDLLWTAPNEDRPKFGKLAAAVKERRTRMKVYKVGDEPEKSVCDVGKTSDGKFAGLRTSALQT
jgi:hypothetical protein